MGLRDIENNVVEVARRDTKEKSSVSPMASQAYIKNPLEEIQQNIYKLRAAFRNENIREAKTGKSLLNRSMKSWFCFSTLGWHGETEEKIKEQTKATIRCIPL